MARTVLCAPSALDEPGNLRRLQPAVRVAQDRLDRARVVGHRVLRKPDKLDAALDRHPLPLDRLAEDAFGLRLRDEQEVVVAAVHLREIETEHSPAAAIDAPGTSGVAEPDQFLGQSALLQQLQRSCLHSDGAGGRRRCGLLVDDAGRDAEAGQFQRGSQPGRPGADDQHRIRHAESPRLLSE